MNAKHLIGLLQARPAAEVVIHDASTDNDLPIAKVDLPYRGPIVIHMEGNDE